LEARYRLPLAGPTHHTSQVVFQKFTKTLGPIFQKISNTNSYVPSSIGFKSVTTDKEPACSSKGPLSTVTD